MVSRCLPSTVYPPALITAAHVLSGAFECGFISSVVFSRSRSCAVAEQHSGLWLFAISCLGLDKCWFVLHNAQSTRLSSLYKVSEGV